MQCAAEKYFQLFCKKICRFKNNSYLCNPFASEDKFFGSERRKIFENTERDNEVKEVKK